MMLKFSPYFSLFVYSGFTFYILNSWKIRKFNKTSVNHFYSLCRYLSNVVFFLKIHPDFYSPYIVHIVPEIRLAMSCSSCRKLVASRMDMTSTLHASFIIEKWTIYSEDFILIFVSNACTLYRIQILQLY